MAVFSKTDDFTRAVAHGEHNLSSGNAALEFFLTASAFDKTAVDTSDLVAAPTDNIADKSVSIVSSNQTGGTWALVVSDKTMLSSGGQSIFRTAYLVNTTAGNKIIGGWDFLGEQTVEDGQNFIADFVDATNRAITLV